MKETTVEDLGISALANTLQHVESDDARAKAFSRVCKEHGFNNGQRHQLIRKVYDAAVEQDFGKAKMWMEKEFGDVANGQFIWGDVAPSRPKEAMM